jgi:hypothetical protein
MTASSDNPKLGGTDGGHGRGFALPEFTHLLDLRPTPQFTDVSALTTLAAQMVSKPDKISDGPDPEENLCIPAGYTYFGQFIDHDLTLDTTSTLDIAKDLKDPSKPANDPSNQRSPRFDLDCVYGNGPDDQPYLYVQADADSLAGKLYKDASLFLQGHDLPRAPNGRALIGDKRNDENSIVNQVQQAFIRFHNQVVRTLVDRGAPERGGALFKRARDEVRWAYQTLITDDFLPRLIEHGTLNAFLAERSSHGDAAYKLYKQPLRKNLPREFVVAAYRYGHSLVRTGYRLNGSAPSAPSGTRLPIFRPAEAQGDSLLGFDPLPPDHVIDDWGRFFPKDHPRPGSRLTVNLGDVAEDPDVNPAVRLQYAYKIDPSLADPLGQLPPKIAQPGDVPGGQSAPSLSLLNLLRGNRYVIQGGQAFEKALAVLTPLDAKYLCTRQRADDDTYSFKPIPEALQKDTPLWFYVLAEAQRHVVDLWLDKGGKTNPDFVLTKDHLLGRIADEDPEHPGVPLARGTATQLGPVGGRIVAEVFYGLLDEDETSVVAKKRSDAAWQPIWGAGPHTFARLLDFTRLPLTDGQP